jgi:hypothetical protein
MPDQVEQNPAYQSPRSDPPQSPRNGGK